MQGPSLSAPAAKQGAGPRRGVAACRNLNYWDSVSTLAGEVPRPHKTVPRALGCAVVLVVITYVGPLLVGLGVTTQVHDWQLGYFAYIAKQASPLSGPSWSPHEAQDTVCVLGRRPARCWEWGRRWLPVRPGLTAPQGGRSWPAALLSTRALLARAQHAELGQTLQGW